MSTQKPDGILIYGELTSENKLRPAVKQLLTKARSLQLKLGGEPVRVCVICGEINCSGIISEAGSYGADEVIIISLAGLEQYDRNYYPEIFYQTALKYFPRIILTGADIQSKEISAYAAARLNTGLTADCTNLDIGENNLLLSTRPAFGGQLTADILCRTFPQMASVQENVFKEEKIEHSAQAKFEIFDLNKFEKRIEIISTESKTPQNKDITKADIVIAGGLGACRDNGFELINKLAEKLCNLGAQADTGTSYKLSNE